MDPSSGGARLLGIAGLVVMFNLLVIVWVVMQSSNDRTCECHCDCTGAQTKRAMRGERAKKVVPFTSQQQTQQPQQQHQQQQQKQQQQPNNPTYLALPKECKKIIVNVGSSVDPATSPDPDTCTIAVEPLFDAASRIPKSNRTFVICAAVGNNTWDLATFWRDKTRNGDSSSLSKITEASKNAWVHLRDAFVASFVPLVPLSVIVERLSPDLDLILLKTDMQGFDFIAVSSIGKLVRRFRKVYSECYAEGFQTYEGPKNAIKSEWSVVHSILYCWCTAV
jgi:hypothetical protein